MNKNPFSRRVTALLIFTAATLLSSILYADEYEERYKLFVPYVKDMPASRLDPALPDMPFEKWLAARIKPGTEMRWEVNDCGEEPGFEDPPTGCDRVTCVGVTADMESGGKLIVYIAVGTEKRGIVGKPQIYSGGDALRALADRDKTSY